MSPVRRTVFSGRTFVVATALIVLIIAALWGASLWLTKRHNDRVASRDQGGVVSLGSASKLVAEIEGHGNAPIYFPDVSGNQRRAVYVTHDGGPSTRGWSAFLAQVPGEASSCQWQWNQDTDRFDASCDPKRHLDASGTGAVHYAVSVVDGKVRLDLRRPATTTTSPATTGS